MTSFASAFGSSDYEDNYSNNTGIHSTTNLVNDHQELNDFSNIDLDQQPKLIQEQFPSYRSLNDAAMFQTDSPSTAGAILNNPSRSPEYSSQIRLFSIPSIDFSFSGKRLSTNTMINTSSSTSNDRRISIPDMSKLSVSSAAAVAAVGPKLDKLKQWSLSTYKCTKQSIYEKLGKTTRTVDIEIDTQIEVLTEENI
jgi:hypothetical protein